MANRIDVCVSTGSRREEYKAAAALKPGHLLERTSAGTVQKHTVSGGKILRRVALEDAYRGKTIDDAYAATDPVQCLYPLPGDAVKLRLPANAAAVVKGDTLISNGDGCVKKGGFLETLLYANTAESAEHENTTDAADFDKSYTIAANTLKAGDVIRIRGHVTVNDNNAADTLTLLLKIGSVTIVSSDALDVADGDIFYFDAEVIVRTIGAAGTIVANGITAYDAAGTDTEPNNFVLAETALDTTAAAKIAVNADWSAAHADNEASLTMLTVELLRGTGGEQLFEADEAVDNSAGGSEAFINAIAL